MRPRHPKPTDRLPRYWLMSDERMGDRLLDAVRRLPRGRSGVVLRNYATPPAERRRLYEAVRRITRHNRLLLLLAGTPARARAWKADGWHGKFGGRPSALIHSMAAHNPAQLAEAARARADIVFVSPVFPTRSHPGTRALGAIGFGLLARRTRLPVVALGGMTSRRYRHIKALGAHGYAAIDDWLAGNETRPHPARL